MLSLTNWINMYFQYSFIRVLVTCSNLHLQVVDKWTKTAGFFPSKMTPNNSIWDYEILSFLWMAETSRSWTGTHSFYSPEIFCKSNSTALDPWVYCCLMPGWRINLKVEGGELFYPKQFQSLICFWNSFSESLFQQEFPLLVCEKSLHSNVARMSISTAFCAISWELLNFWLRLRGNLHQRLLWSRNFCDEFLDSRS